MYPQGPCFLSALHVPGGQGGLAVWGSMDGTPQPVPPLGLGAQTKCSEVDHPIRFCCFKTLSI